MRVLIAGAGIGGLTAALALHAAGIESSLVEGARELRPLGVGINLLPHAVRELTDLGLGDDLARIGVAITENVYCDRSGTTLFTEKRGLAGGYDRPQYAVHRGRLQMLLLSAVRERLGADAVRTGARLTGFTQDAESVRAQAGGTESAADLLVGADGLHSAVRAQLHPDQGPLAWSGVRMWRGVTERRPFLGGESMLIARGAGVVARGAGSEAGLELIAYPIKPDLVNWVAQVQVADPGPLPGDANWNLPGRPEDVLRHIGHWKLGLLDVPALIADSSMILEYPMVDRDPLPSWGSGRVTLLGDAAHPMYPVGANGASQAVVDARALADALAGAGGPAGLAAYERTRREATAAVIAANREMHAGAGARTPAELARITERYRRATGADRPQHGRPQHDRHH
ncbi:FAD-dependent monooxygenase [Streptomyces syringium]|uniref:2-polyprenyl-6-methoxyphenol hydroxylase-like FAD-dependent oxidoreductase n=1 Tax=Streptomyces syringium TaxID=76729 RepID=A0ABS4YB41_9ACTN|nr:FAD-dependent monooxygenase [Streptomyces syringium]MBP2406004.1 2-polyprenyl-6-methoxyphenol hydroxylase-like FAD-dependent oxidoreductase [Streptomyces syringium]